MHRSIFMQLYVRDAAPGIGLHLEIIYSYNMIT